MIETVRDRRAAARARREATDAVSGLLYPRGFWQTLATPGVLWLLLFFVVPFYAILAMATGRLDPIFGTAVPEWNPAYWTSGSFTYVFQNLLTRGGLFQVVFLRTLRYVFSTVVLCLLIGYPVAYYLSRLSGRVRNIMLMLLVLPFWISYLMRMLAWVNLLQQDGYVNRFLTWTGILDRPVAWLEGRSSTVVFGLAYGYVPFLILPLFAALDRIDKNLLEAALDLGASRFRTFVRVTLPLSKQGVLAGIAIIMLPMFGDYFTADLLSGRPTTSMIGSQIVFYMTGSTLGASQARGAALVVVLSVMVSVLTLYYIVNTAKASRTARQL
ncbi:MAG: ABC transporter permease [Actinobacteria bacterium]|nr:ABC transporter permease [Actinomycetota bacterium]